MTKSVDPSPDRACSILAYCASNRFLMNAFVRFSECMRRICLNGHDEVQVAGGINLVSRTLDADSHHVDTWPENALAIPAFTIHANQGRSLGYHQSGVPVLSTTIIGPLGDVGRHPPQQLTMEFAEVATTCESEELLLERAMGLFGKDLKNATFFHHSNGSIQPGGGLKHSQHVASRREHKQPPC